MISKSLIKTLTQPPHWINRPNDTNEIILGTVGRLVRNISGCVFPGWSTEEQRREVAEKVVPAIRKLPGQKAAYDLPMEEIPYELRRLMRLHRRLSAVMSARGAGCHLICNPNRDEVFMVNEEEHIAYHCFRPGNDMPRVLRRIRETAGKLDKALPIARNESRGVLTSCPEDCGDGTVFSCILHLPALDIAGYMPQAARAAEQLDLGICPYYPMHHNRNSGCGIYTLFSGMSPLGHTDEVAANLATIASRLAEKERMMRNELYRTALPELVDRIHRSYAIISYARLLSFEEAVDHMSMISLGLDIGCLGLADESEIPHLPLLMFGAEVSTPAMNLCMMENHSDPGNMHLFLRSDLVRFYMQDIVTKELFINESNE